VSKETTRIIRKMNRRIMDMRKLTATKKLVERSELDSHADTCCAGANATVLKYTGAKVSVQPFTDTYKVTTRADWIRAGTNSWTRNSTATGERDATTTGPGDIVMVYISRF
jgi:hypothetical protein